jgi:hypothetical protein
MMLPCLRPLEWFGVVCDSPLSGDGISRTFLDSFAILTPKESHILSVDFVFMSAARIRVKNRAVLQQTGPAPGDQEMPDPLIMENAALKRESASGP